MQQHSIETVGDSSVVGRVVRIAQLQAMDGRLPARDLSALLDVAKISPHMREFVLKALEDEGISVTGSSDDEWSTDEECGDPDLFDRPSAHPILASDESIHAARARLSRDRRSLRPWKQLLTAQEEVGLAALIRGSEIALNAELPEDYRRLLPTGDERALAYDALLLHNLGLVWSIAQRHGADGMDYEDIAQHGVLGLIRAIQKFDATRGYKFSTYATWWIRQAIQRGLMNEGRLIRVPVHMLERINKVERARAQLITLYGQCTVKDIANATALPISQVIECLRLSIGIVSLDIPVGDQSDGVLADFIADDPERLTDPATVFDQVVTVSLIENSLDMLPERQATILRLRAGMVDGEPWTLEQIGQVYGLTRERIRQVERQASESLRRLLEARGIKRASGKKARTKSKLLICSASPQGPVKDVASSVITTGVCASSKLLITSALMSMALPNEAAAHHDRQWARLPLSALFRKPAIQQGLGLGEQGAKVKLGQLQFAQHGRQESQNGTDSHLGVRVRHGRLAERVAKHGLCCRRVQFQVLGTDIGSGPDPCDVPDHVRIAVPGRETSPGGE